MCQHVLEMNFMEIPATSGAVANAKWFSFENNSSGLRMFNSLHNWKSMEN